MSAVFNLSYPVLQFRSRSIIAYNEYVYPRNGSHKIKLSHHLQKVRENHKAYSGTITAGAKKRLTKAVSLLVQSTKQREIKNPITNKWQSFRLSFITLTIPQNNVLPDGKFCNKFLLEPMIRVLRRRYGLKNYVWKLELQRNGMVHYHLTSNVFINHVHLKEEWNKILDKNDLLNDYRKRTGNLFPNSTDIKSVKNIKNLEAYLVKYIAKESQNEKAVNSKVWDCSRALKKAQYYSLESSWTYADRLKSLEEKGKVSSFAGDRYVIYKFKENPVYLLLNENDKRNYYIHLNLIRNGKEKSNDKSTANVSVTELGNSERPISEIKKIIQFRLFGDGDSTSRARKRLSSGKETFQVGDFKAFINSY